MPIGTCILGLIPDELVESEFVTGGASLGRDNTIVSALMVVGFRTMAGVIP